MVPAALVEQVTQPWAFFLFEFAHFLHGCAKLNAATMSKAVWVLLAALLLAHLAAARHESEWCHEARRECRAKCKDGDMQFKCADDERGRAVACSCVFAPAGGWALRRGRPLPALKQRRRPLRY